MSADGATWPLPPVVSLSDLGDLGPAVAAGGGQSVGIHALANYPGWLLKKYKTSDANGGVTRLDGLVAFPMTVPDDDRTLLRNHTSWPVARLTGAAGHCLGCVIPVAPATFRAAIPIGGESSERYLEVDWLAKPDDSLRSRGLPVPSPLERRKVCRSIVAVAALLERHRFVYSDWSYSNAFWSTSDLSAYVIDVDGCWVTSVPNVFQPNWDDPLTPRSDRADVYTDRYRVALLVGRCITGLRDRVAMLHKLVVLKDSALGDLLLDILLARERTRRPSTTALLAVLDGLPYFRIPLERKPLPPEPTGVVPVPTVSVRPPAVSSGPAATGTPTPATRVAVGVLVGVFVFIVLVLLVVIFASSG